VLNMVIIHYIVLGLLVPKYLLLWTHPVVLIHEGYVEILILFFWDSVNSRINVVAELGGSLNHNFLAQGQWISSTVNKGWFSQISHLLLMNLNSNVTHFTTVTSYCLFLSFSYRQKISMDNSSPQVTSSD
jgi:hypothetical protein